MTNAERQKAYRERKKAEKLKAEADKVSDSPDTGGEAGFESPSALEGGTTPITRGSNTETQKEFWNRMMANGPMLDPEDFERVARRRK